MGDDPVRVSMENRGLRDTDFVLIDLSPLVLTVDFPFTSCHVLEAIAKGG